MFRILTPQRLFIAGFLLALTLVIARMVTLQGWLRPVRVASGSMVEQLLGEHYSVVCGDCSFVFPFGVESLPRNDQAVCPNCGYDSNPVQKAVRRRGEQVTVDRAVYLFESPQRFDLVAFRDPRQPVRLAVKRIVGLPGERLAVQRGDLFLNGKIMRKNLAEFRQMSLFVHDNDYRPKSQQLFLPRWRPENNVSGWRADGAGFHFAPQLRSPPSMEKKDSEIDWLTYHHWRGYANLYPRSAEAPVADNYAYNQGESRELQPVSDLVLRCKISLPPTGACSWRIHDGHSWFALTLQSLDRTATLRREENVLAKAVIAPALWNDPLDVEFGMFDQQIVLGIAGQEVLRQSYEPPAGQVRETIAQPVAIGGQASELRIIRLELRRDIHYLDPWAVGNRWETEQPAGPRQYLVLGDNPPISDDARNWPSPFLPADSLLGRVAPRSRRIDRKLGH